MWYLEDLDLKKNNMKEIKRLGILIEGLEMAKNELKCSEVYINERIQELEEEIGDLYNE